MPGTRAIAVSLWLALSAIATSFLWFGWID
jgi:hypothetical protein